MIINLALILTLGSCSGDGCVDGDDFGDQESQTLTVYSNTNQSSCDYDPGVADADQTSELIKACLLENSKSIVDRNGVTFNSSTGCKGFIDAELNRLCKDKCVSDCQINSTSMGAQPSWTSNTALLSDSGSGVNIPKNSEITITAKGNLILGNDIVLPSSSVAFNEIMPHSYASSTFSSPSIIDINKGQSINIKFSKNSTANIDGSNPIDDYNFARRLVGYIVPHPQNYDFMLSDPVNGHLNVPLTPRFNGWKCSYSSSDSLQSECSYGSKEIDAYNADTNSLSLTDLYSTQDSSVFRINNATSSLNFNVSSEFKKIIDYGGFIRWKNDPFKNYNHDPFASFSCSSSGVCSVINDPTEGIIVGDLSGGFSYTNNDAYSKEASFKQIGSFCPNLTFSELAVYNQVNKKIYYINNFSTNSSYSVNKIPFYAGYRITLTPNSTVSAGSSVNCGKFLVMRMIKYNDIIVNKSGFVSFRIVDNDSSQTSQNPNCLISARIINPNGEHPVINDSALLANSYNFKLNTGSFNLPMPPANLTANVFNAYSGAITLNNTGINYITSTSDCFEDIRQKITDRYAQCFAGNINPCVLNTSSALFSSFSNCSASGIGENGQESSTTTGGGGGGGGGGNINGIATLNSTSGSGIAGTSGTSFYNEFFHNTNPTTSSPTSSLNGYKGVSGINGSNGQVKIYNCATGVSCSPTTFNYNSAVQYQTYNVPASGTVRYEIYGAGGGGGGSSCGSASNTLGGEGASGTIVTGELKNIDATKTPSLRIYIGAGGPAGYSACSANYSNNVSYSTPFSFTSVSPNKFSKINFASYGFPVISTRNFTSSSATHNFAINPYCHSRASKVIAVDNCIGNSTCSIAFTNSTFNSLDLTGNCVATGNGENGASNTSSDNNGSGGGAGGGNGSLGTTASASGTIAGGAKGSSGDGTAGTSGDSYFDPGYHSSQPTVASASNANANGSAIITPSGGSATNFTNVGPSTYTVPAGTTSLSYVIKGAGGGNGGNASNSRIGGTGASGTQLTGSISVSAGDIINVNIGEKGYDGAHSNYIPPIKFLDGSSVNISSNSTASTIIYGTAQRTSANTYTVNSYCNSSNAISNFNSNIASTNLLVNDTNFGTTENSNTSPAESCQSGQGSSASSSTSLTNAGGAGGAGGGNGGTSTSGKINAGAVANNTTGGAGTSGESFFQPYYHQSAPASATTATNQANTSQSASDGVAILKQTSSSGAVLKNLTSATSDSYTVTADGTIYYELTGAGGGKGGKDSNSQSTAPGNGAGGAKITGTLNVKTGDVIKIYVGKAGTNGQNCGNVTNYFNTSEFTPLSISGLGCSITSIDFANYGTPTTSTTPYTVNAACSSGSLTANTNITTPCIGNTSCSVYATNAIFGDPCPIASSTNTFSSAGSNGSNSSSSDSLAGGGGGGGSYSATSGGSASQPGSTGPSFYNTTYISTAPTLSNLSNNSRTSENQNGSSGADGAIKLCDSDTTSNCQNFSAGISEYTIPSNGRFYFEISGAGGGAGGSGDWDGSTGGSGAGGTKIIGSVNQGVTANDKIYVYVGGGGAGGSTRNSSASAMSGGSASSSGLFFLGADGGGKDSGIYNTYVGSGGAGGGASFLNYKGNLIALASGGGGGGSGGAGYIFGVTTGVSASVNSTLNSGSSSSSFFTYTLKKLAVQASCGSATTSKGIGGAISVSGSVINILKGGDGSETISGATCSGGGGGGGGGASALMINDETVAIAGGGGGGGGNNSSSGGTSATANTSLRNYLKVVPDKKYLLLALNPTIPTKSTYDTKILGGTGGAINYVSGTYLGSNSNGQGGDGGGGTMLSINNRVIAIAGGGGGGGGASINGSASSSRNASNSNNILDKLKAGPFGPYLAISAEYRGGTAGYVNSSQISNGSNLVINTPASSYFNDIAFASYGDNFTTPFLYANTCSNETNLSTLLQTNCLEKNTCTSAISNSLGGGQSCSTPANYKGLAKLTYQSSLQSFAQAPVSTIILVGGNGGKNGLKECSGGGGAGGGATAISVVSHSDYSEAQEQFVAIAGGGGGGGGASCSGAVSSSANGSNSNTIVNTLTNKALGTWISAQISFPRPTVRNAPEDYYEYDDFAIPDASSADPLKSLSVNSAGFTTFSGSTLTSNKIFVRKGQIIRFSPNSWQSNWNTKNNLSRQCGVGMVIQVEPRPALVCLGSKSEKIINPNCIPDFNYDSDSPIPLGCQSQSSSCNGTYNASLNKYVNICNGICQKKITCSTPATEANNYTKSGCSLTGTYEITGDGISCSLKNDSNPADANTTSACTSCNNARLTAAQLPFYLSGNFDQCFDLENYTGKIQNLVNNQSNQSIIDSYISSKGLSYLKPFNGEYGNFENYSKISDHNYELKSPINSALKGRLRFFVVDGYDLNIPSLNTYTYSNFYSDNNGFATINPTVSMTARNGQWLEIKLCKEDSQTSRNCRSINIDSSKDLSTANKSQSAVIDITSSSPLSFSSINYKFNSDGLLYRDTDPIVGKDCNSTNASSAIASGVSSAVALNASGVSSSVSSLLTPNSSVVTSKNSKFYCHTDNTDSKLLRLSFKIFDPEILNCNTITGSRSSATGAFDGIILKNNYYNSNTSSNTGAVCTNSELASKNCEKEFICIDKYANNTGTYEVKIKVKKNLGASQLINSIMEPVLFWLDGNPNSPNPNERIGFAEYIYKSLITNVIYVSILKFTMVLAIMFYGLGYLMGVSELSQTQIITRAFKIGFIYLFVGETGWKWFKIIFVDFYKDGVAQAVFLMTSAFNEAPEIRQALDTNNFSNKALLFSGVDQVITILFSSAIHKKIWAFLFTGIFGWSYILIFYFSIFNFIFALANSILLFLTAQVMISLLFIMGPLFFIFLLFSQTKDMFDNWLKAMTGFALQQIFLLTTLAFFNMLFIEVLKMSLGYSVCWDDAWVINLGLRFTITKFWVISSLPPRTNMSDDIMETGNPESIPSLFSILYIWVVASLMKKMVTLMTDVATSISDGIKASEIGQGIAAIGSKIKSAGASAAGNAVSSMTSGLDDKLFDSGSIAKKKRNDLNEQAKSDMSARKKLLGAADEAEKAYKADPNNIAKLGDMSKEEQNKEIQRVRSEAIDKKAAKMGIKGKNKERILNGTGLRYYGNNFFGALYQAGKQGVFKGGALKKSIAEREGMGNKIGREEAFKASELMNPQQGEKFAKDVAQGKINVARNRMEKIWDNKKRIGAALLSVGLSEIGLRASKAITDRVSKSSFGELRKLAVSQLEDEGKIAKTGSTSMSNRNDDEQKMIRDRMRSISDERKDKGKKDLSKKIGKKSSRSFSKRFNNKKKSLQKAINEAIKNNDLEKYNKLSDIEDAIYNAEFISEDDDNYNSANELMDDFNKTDFDRNDSIDDLMSKDSFTNLKDK